jgi:hypothetical protein
MAAHGVFVAAAGGLVATVRGDQLLVAALRPEGEASSRFLRFELLAEPEALATDKASTDADAEAEAEAPAVGKRISAFQFFQPGEDGAFAVLLLVNERQLVHYELDAVAQCLVFRSSRCVRQRLQDDSLASAR